jgi:hypothetical protein
MAVTLVILAFGLFALGLTTAGLATGARQVVFLAQAYRVQGTVIKEWRYRIYGRWQRYYRVEFRLRNGQRAELRGSGACALGEAVPVMVRERSGHDPKAQIATWSQLWLPSIPLLANGSIATLTLISMMGILWR